MIINRKQNQENCVENQKNRVYDVSKSFKEFTEMTVVSVEPNVIYTFSNTYVEVAFDQQLLANTKEIRKQTTFIDIDSNNSHRIGLSKLGGYPIDKF